jgi:hypothetical protein
MPKRTDIRVSGPFFKFSNPYGTGTTCHRDEYYVSRTLSNSEQKTEIQKITGEACLGQITMPHRRGVFIISQLFPEKSFKTLQGAVNFLVKNEGKLVFCS